MSAALSRLRHATGDPLFVRQGNRMVPTARAEALAGPLRAALSAIERSLLTPDRFEPGAAAHRFRIHGSDYFSTLLLPPLSAVAEAEAPGVVLSLLDLPGRPEEHLAKGSADLCLDIGRPVPDWIEREVLFQSFLVGVAARGNPALASVEPGSVVPEAIFAKLRHGLVTGDGSTRGTLDADLEARGIRRTVVLTLPHFHAIARAAADSGLFATLPRHFARAVAPRFGLEIYALPVTGPKIDVTMYWHARHSDDPASQWLRAKVREVATGLPAQ